MTGFGHQTRHHARQRAFHAGHDDEHVRALNRFQPREQPMQARHAHVVQCARRGCP